MRRACFLLSLGAIVCIAQERGFVNRRLPMPDFLKAPAGKPSTAQRLEKPCLHIDPIERLVRKDVDRSMVIAPKSPSGDDRMILPSPPFCRDAANQGRPKN